jgi:hypothetical protein
MSPDGKLAAMTVFISGHSYSSPGFSTRTSIVDVTTGEMLIEDLEQFRVLHDGRSVKAADFNFWGVTFARKGGRFYATLGTAGKRYLVEGDVAERTMRVVHDNAECPSLSPDNRRIAFKRRRGDGDQGQSGWKVQVLDLTSMTELPANRETRDVDDQVEWLNDDEIVYAMPDNPTVGAAVMNLWSLRIDGSSPPKLLVPLASSPTAIR